MLDIVGAILSANFWYENAFLGMGTTFALLLGINDLRVWG